MTSAPDGGDPACWLDEVCDECGGIREPGVPHVCRTPVPGAAGGPSPDDRP